MRNCSCCTERHAGTPQHSVHVAKRSDIRVNELIHYNNVYTYSVRYEIQFSTKDNILSGLPTCICIGTLRNETFPNIDTTRIYNDRTSPPPSLPAGDVPMRRNERRDTLKRYFIHTTQK